MPSPKHPRNLTERQIALCYVRQSFTHDENDTNSPERQRANIEAFCQKMGWTPEWYIDADGHKSGRYVANRPGWLSLEARLNDPDVAAVVANDTSRFHRKFWRMGRLVDELDDLGVVLAFADPSLDLDTSTPQGRMIISFMAMQDEYYANDIARRARSSIAYRKAQGKTVGRPPFGTVRDEEGYLTASSEGAWLLPDGRHVAGQQGEQPPQDDAIWRGYYDCAERVLVLYSENKRGLERLAYQMTQEGWAFRDRKGQPRPLKRDDVRRVVSSWREYAGIITDGRGKDKNASLIDDPLADLYQTGREVFDYDLLRQVAEVQKARSSTTRPFGSVQKAHPYPLARLLYCAHCERNAAEQDDPRLQSRLSGWNMRGNLRYRHAEGITCGCQTRSIERGEIEADFRRLISLLSIDPDQLAAMTELAIQSEYGGNGGVNDADLAAQKTAAIARCKRRIAAAKALFLDGDMSREDYLKRKQENERQIAHWESRTSETEQAALELKQCIESLKLLTDLWDHGTDEDRQQLARMMFEYVVYDLDLRQIVDFRLKAWADRYLVLRAELYRQDDGDDDPDGGGSGASGARETKKNATLDSLKRSTDLCPIGAFGPQYGASLDFVLVAHATAYLLTRFRRLPKPIHPTLTTRERNITIRARFAAGESQADLARAFGLSYQRIHQIVRNKHR